MDQTYLGSKAIASRHVLGVSPATIRNDMAVLEEEGLITAPHTSAGRVPTDKGYRVFVDRLSAVKPLSTAERRAIHTYLDQSVDLDDVMHRTVRLLAQITKQVAMVQYPSLSRSTIRTIELVAVPPSRLLVILVADTGRIEQRMVELPAELPQDTMAVLRERLNGIALERIGNTILGNTIKGGNTRNCKRLHNILHLFCVEPHAQLTHL